jgi:hypothetical protein
MNDRFLAGGQVCATAPVKGDLIAAAMLLGIGVLLIQLTARPAAAGGVSLHKSDNQPKRKGHSCTYSLWQRVRTVLQSRSGLRPIRQVNR